MKILIADNDPLAIKYIYHLLQQIYTDCQPLYYEANNGKDAITICHKHHPDLVLIDIKMPIIGGIEATIQMQKMEQPPAIIFCTDYENLAHEAFDVHTTGYLLKPIKKESLERILHNASQPNRLQKDKIIHKPSLQNDKHHIAVPSLKGVELIPVDEILYFMADNKYVTVYHMKSGYLSETLMNKTLKNIEKNHISRFIMIHRNTLISRNAIKSLIRNNSGRYFIKLKNLSETIPVSRRHVRMVKHIMDKL